VLQGCIKLGTPVLQGTSCVTWNSSLQQPLLLDRDRGQAEQTFSLQAAVLQGWLILLIKLAQVAVLRAENYVHMIAIMLRDVGAKYLEVAKQGSLHVKWVLMPAPVEFTSCITNADNQVCVLVLRGCCSATRRCRDRFLHLGPVCHALQLGQLLHTAYNRQPNSCILLSFPPGVLGLRP
jgi:hypothetical protein